MSEPSEKISRRQFLKTVGSAAGIAVAAPLLPTETKEKPKDTELPDWKEISPLTQAGAELFGVVTEDVESGRVNEIRAYRLPPNPEFKDSFLIAISSRLFPQNLSEDEAAVNSYGGMRILVLPNEPRSITSEVQYSKTLTFGKLKLDIVQKNEGRVKIWESDFYVNGNKLPNYENSSFETHVEHLGNSEKYVNKKVYFSDENCHILTSQGVETREERTLVFETGRGGLGSVVVPKDLPDRELKDITVARAGKLTLVKGLTENPFSYVCEAEIPDGQRWVWSGQSTNSLNLAASKEFMGIPFSLNMEVEIDPEILASINRAADEISSMWGTVTSYTASERRLPFFTEASGENYLGEPIKKPEYNLELVIEERDTFEGRQTKIAINQYKIKIQQQEIKPQPQA